MKKEEYCRQVGIAIWRATLDSGMTSKEVSKRAKVASSILDAYIRGDRQPTLRAWSRLEEVLGPISLPSDIQAPRIGSGRYARKGQIACPGLARAIVKAGVEKASLARIIGVSRQRLYKWLSTGKIPDPRASEIAAALGCSIEDLKGEK